MGVWHWLTVKRSKKSPFIRIPKDVLEQLGGMRGLYVVVTDEREKFEKLLEVVR